MRTGEILTDTTNHMSTYSSNAIKNLWDSRLRSYRGASLDSATAAIAGPSSTPRRSSSSSALLGKGFRTPSTGGRSVAGGLTDSERRLSISRPLSAASPSSASAASAQGHRSATPAAASGAPARGRSLAISTLKRRSSSLATPTSGSAVERLARRERCPSPLAKSLFRDPYLLQQMEPREQPPLLTVVLDLDETLVSNRSVHLSRAILRPYCLHVLHALRHMKGVEIVLWTASTKETATPVLDQLHALGPIFDHVIFRNDLWFTDGIHTKDLRRLGRDMDRVIIVDNSANCCKLNPRNALLIEDFHGFRHEEDAALVNVYYVVEALLKLSSEGMPVSDGIVQLAGEGNLCHPVMLTLPEVWKFLPLSEIQPLKIPPHGTFYKANSPPPSRSIMKYWKY